MATTITTFDDLRMAIAAYSRQHGLPPDLGAAVEAVLTPMLRAGDRSVALPTATLQIPISDEPDGPWDVSVKHDQYLADWRFEGKLGFSR